MNKTFTSIVLRGAFVAASTLLFCSAVQAASIKSQDWSGQCDGQKQCFVQMGGDGPRLLLGWSQQSKAVRLLVLLPPDVGVKQRVTIWTDDNYSIYLVTNSCSKSFCEAAVAPHNLQKVISTLKKAGEGVLAFPEGDQLRVVPISLHGFTKASAAVFRGVR